MPKLSQKRVKRVTIKDVASVAGVSVTTVSNVLNGRTETMTADTLARIQETIQTLNYHPSSVARSMVTQRTATIGLIMAEIETALFLQALVVEPLARAANHNILLCTPHNFKAEQQALELLLEKQVDGIIFLSQSHYVEDDYLDNLSISLPPMVLINRTTNQKRFDQIHWDNTAGVVEAIDYLVQAGHRHIATLSGPTNRRSAIERIKGYTFGLEKHNLEYREEYIQLGDYDTEPKEWEQATLKLLNVSPRPTAILASNDIVGAVVMRTIQRAGFRVPEDITVIGYDNQPFCVYLNPALTSVEIPIKEAARQAIEILLERISNPTKASEHRILPCPLIVRESSGSCNQLVASA